MPIFSLQHPRGPSQLAELEYLPFREIRLAQRPEIDRDMAGIGQKWKVMVGGESTGCVDDIYIQTLYVFDEK